MTRSRDVLGPVVVLCVIALLGLSKLAYPLMDDQAGFLIGARTIATGGVLYRDFWDIKPPGIFLFYLAGGGLFGFTEIGVHAFELVYMLLFAATLILTLKKPLGHRVACLAALFTVGSYYVMSSEWWLTNVESIVNFPIFLVLVGLAQAGDAIRDKPFWLFLVGLASGLVFVFKPVLFVIPFSLWLLFWGLNNKVGRRWTTWGLLGAVASLPFLGTLAWFCIDSASPFLFETLFLIPIELSRSIDPWSRFPVLLVGIKWFAEKAAPLIFLAGVGIYFIWRRSGKRGQALGIFGNYVFLVRGLLVWVVAGSAAILAQVVSWWDYHWLLLLCPLAILSAIAVSTLVTDLCLMTRAHFVRLAVLVAALALSIPMGIELTSIVGSFDRRLAALQSSKRMPYQRAFSSWYDTLQSESAFLSLPGALKGPIFVWGSPLIYVLSGREPASAVQGWNLHLTMTMGLFDRQADDLERTLPCYIFLTHKPHEDFVLQVPRLRSLMRDHYTVQRRGSLGTWHRRKDGPCAESNAVPAGVVSDIQRRHEIAAS